MEEMERGQRGTDATTLALIASTTEGWRVVNLWATRIPTPDSTILLGRATGLAPPSSADDEEALARELFVPIEWLRDVLWLLEDKRGVVFYDDLPVLLAGAGGGYLTPGRHLRYDTEQPMANLFIAMLDAAGVAVASFGQDGTGPLDLS